MSTFVLRAALVVFALALAGCATNPVTGQRELSLVSTSREAQIGREGHAAIMAEYGVYPDSALQAYVDSLGRRLAAVSHLPSAQWTFTVIDDPVVNAFALPGGYIYITRGILAHLNSEAQLAGVLGHEIAHVTARHSAQRLTQQQFAGLGLQIAGLFSEEFRRYSQAAETALGLLFLKHGRDDENQADDLGVSYTRAAGYDPREIPPTYAVLGRLGERSGQRLPGFLSTHPDPGDREERTRALASKAAAGATGLRVLGREHLRRLDRVVFGADPRQGYFEGVAYYHPTLGFEIRFPAGWSTRDSRTAVVASAPGERGALQFGIARSTLDPAGFVASLLQSGQVVEARGAAETIGGFPGWAGTLTLPPDAQGASQSLVAAFVRVNATLMYEVLGRGAGEAERAAILTCARSFRSLADPGRRSVEPDRLQVLQAPRPGEFRAVIEGLGAQALGLEETAILNNARVDQEVRAGEWLKIVKPGRQR